MNNRIAVFTNGFSNEFIEHVVTGLQRKAAEDGVDVFVFVTYCSANENELQNKCQLNIFHLPDPTTFDGAIMLTNTYNFSDEQERVCARFQRAGVPMLSVEGEVPNMSCIKTENYQGIKTLATHLVEHHNARKIIFVNGIEGNAENNIRRQALIDVLTEHGLELYTEFKCDFGFYTAYLSMNAFLDAGRELPDAIVCANDNMALGINSALCEHGFSVPDDVLLTGFDMIKDGQYTFPILSTVSRGWDKIGELAYDKLKYQREHPGERFVEEYHSYFVPSESCGCPASAHAIKSRFNMIRNSHFENLQQSIIDIFFQRMQIPLSMAEKKEDFYEKGIHNNARDIPQLGQNYCLCTEPEFFELDDEEYPARIRGYSSHMDILYELRDGNRFSVRPFDSKELYPDYDHKEGESNLYIFAPMNYLNFIIGYVAIKNSPKLLYSLDLGMFIKNMNAQLFSMRRHIFSERRNNELKKIYMTDALSGMYNRTGCENVLYDYITARKQQNLKSILVFADIDRMKTINDVYGHLNGDFAIKATAEAFKTHSPKEWLFGRYGGDEFIAVGPCPDSEIEQLIRQLSESMSAEFKSLNLAFVLHASIGYTIIEPGEDATIDDYIERADKYMYDEKEKYHKYLDSLNQPSKED